MGLQGDLLELPFVRNERGLRTYYLVESCSGAYFFGFFILRSQAKNFPRTPSCRRGSNSPTSRQASSGNTENDSFLQASMFEHSSPQKPRILQLPKQVGLTPLPHVCFSAFGQAAPLH
jgi:hypothetical protein